MSVFTRILLVSFVWCLNAQAQTTPMMTPARKEVPAAEANRQAPAPSFKKYAVIMIAVNYSPGEIAAARSAAKARGEQFVLLPELTKNMKAVGESEYEAETFEHRVMDPLRTQIDSAKGEEREFLERKFTAVRAHADRLETKSQEANKRVPNELPSLNGLLSAKIKVLEAAGVGVDSLVISGHDGGGGFMGSFGNTSMRAIAELAKEDPKFKGSLRSVYLAGCYTATTDQAKAWKTSFPNMEMVAGYDQPAPLRDAHKGWNYLHDTMVMQNKLTTTKDLKSLNLLANKITDINKSSSAFATFPKCEDPAKQREFYRGKVSGYKVTEFDINMCKNAQSEFEKNADLYHQYSEGDLPLPKNTSNSPLRELYTFYRNHEICYGLGYGNGPHAEEVFFLMFNRGVRANFSKYFAESLKDSLEKINNIDFNQLKVDAVKKEAELTAKQKDNPSEFAMVDSRKLRTAKKINRLFKDKPELADDLKDFFKKLNDPEQLKSMSMKEMRKSAGNSFQYLELIEAKESFYQESDSPLLRQVYGVYDQFNTYVIAGKCIPMSWHEEAKGRPEAPGHCDN